MLYGLDSAKKAISTTRSAVVVEGYTDVMACHLAGVETAVATCGTAFGVEHIKVLRRIMRDEADLAPARVIFTFDGDKAGPVSYTHLDVYKRQASGRVDPRVLYDPTEVRVVADVARTAYAPDLDLAALEAAATRLVATGTVPRAFTGTRADLAALKDMTSRLIGRFVYAVEVATRARHGDGPLTRYAADLAIPDDVRAECVMLKAVAAHYVMQSDERQRVAGVQAEIIEGLLAHFGERPEQLDEDLSLIHI